MDVQRGDEDKITLKKFRFDGENEQAATHRAKQRAENDAAHSEHRQAGREQQKSKNAEDCFVHLIPFVMLMVR